MIWLLKLAVTPLLVGAMSLAVRVWGPTLGSLIIGLPWMTGPVLFVLGLDRGTPWVRDASIGVLLGTVAIASFALGYAVTARWRRWHACLLTATHSFAVAGFALADSGVGLAVATLLAAGSLVLARALIPAPPAGSRAGPLPWWDIPARMTATAVLVVVIALSSEVLHPAASGIVATFPVLTTVIGSFTHAQWGREAVTALLRGLLLSLQSFVAFFLVTALTVEPLGLFTSYALATGAALVVTGMIVLTHRARQRALAAK